MKRFFITGTNTDVGKTFVSSLLFNTLENPCYYKPVQTGYGDTSFISDMEFVKNNSSITNEDNFKCSYKLNYPFSPHLSSRKTNIEINLNKIIDDYLDICKEFEEVVVEGSGGVIVPINDKEEYIYTLIKTLNIPCILVTTTKVGTINSTLLTLEFLKEKSIPVHGIVFNMFEGMEHEIDNINFIKNYSGITNTINVPITNNINEINRDEIKEFIDRI